MVSIDKSGPSMPKGVQVFFDAKIRLSKCYLEYGSGESTIRALQLRVNRLLSVESDRMFYKELGSRIQDMGFNAGEGRLWVDIGETKRWGYPVDGADFSKWHSYVTSIWAFARHQGWSPDLVLIDGRFRVACFLYCLVSCEPGSTIIFDDYMTRRVRYGAVEKYCTIREIIGRSAVFIVPVTSNIKELVSDFARYLSQPG